MSDQFDLEQGILSCWNITSDLDVLLEEIIEGDLTKDQISNVVLGLHQLYEIKFSKTFRTFEAFLKTYYQLKKDVERLEREKVQLEEGRAAVLNQLAKAVKSKPKAK
jgi:hypothetical protein